MLEKRLQLRAVQHETNEWLEWWMEQGSVRGLPKYLRNKKYHKEKRQNWDISEGSKRED